MKILTMGNRKKLIKIESYTRKSYTIIFAHHFIIIEWVIFLITQIYIDNYIRLIYRLPLFFNKRTKKNRYPSIMITEKQKKSNNNQEFQRIFLLSLFSNKLFFKKKNYFRFFNVTLFEGFVLFDENEKNEKLFFLSF